MKTLTLFSALEALVRYRAAKRTNEEDRPGQAVTEEKGATFGKVTGIEEVIARHAANVAFLKSATETLFNSDIQKDRRFTDVGQIEVGSIVVVRSTEYGEEIYGIDVSADNVYRVSPFSPFAKALLKHRKGDIVIVNDTQYQIVDIHSVQDKQTIKIRLENLERRVLDEAEEVLSEAKGGLKSGELRRRLKVSELLDWIQLAGLIRELYAVDSAYHAKLLETGELLEKEEHFPVDDLESSSGYIYIMNRIAGNAEHKESTESTT